MTLQVRGVDDREAEISVMPNVKISRLKMTVKRALKLPGAAKVTLAYIPVNVSATSDKITST